MGDYKDMFVYQKACKLAMVNISHPLQTNN
jgi:hypothetical protein